MNIFVLDLDPLVCAHYHCDKHVTKMVVEYTQLLATCHWHFYKRGEHDSGWWLQMPKPMNENHPCALWVRRSAENYNWLHELLTELLQEFRRRFGHSHSYERQCVMLIDPPDGLVSSTQGVGRTNFIQSVPEQFWHADPTIAYRSYYVVMKSSFATWRHPRSAPMWYQHAEVELLRQDCGGGQNLLEPPVEAG